jgi:hypothetical protein
MWPGKQKFQCQPADLVFDKTQFSPARKTPCEPGRGITVTLTILNRFHQLACRHIQEFPIKLQLQSSHKLLLTQKVPARGPGRPTRPFRRPERRERLEAFVARLNFR